MDTISSSINFTIYKDIHNLLNSLHHEYNINIETLLYRYMPNISVEKKMQNGLQLFMEQAAVAQYGLNK